MRKYGLRGIASLVKDSLEKPGLSDKAREILYARLQKLEQRIKEQVDERRELRKKDKLLIAPPERTKRRRGPNRSKPPRVFISEASRCLAHSWDSGASLRTGRFITIR